MGAQITWLVQVYPTKAVSLHSYLDVSENSGIPKSSILIGFSIINHPFWGTSIFGNPLIAISMLVDAACSLFQTRSANYVLCLLLEPCRLYLGYAGNLGEKVWASGH